MKQPWLDDDLLHYLNEKNYLLRHVKFTGDEDDWKIACFHRNRAKDLTREAKHEYYNNKFEEYKSDCKKILAKFQ